MKIFWLLFLAMFSTASSAELYLTPEQTEITLNETASPKTIKIALKDNNNVISWDSKGARLIAASILVRDEKNNYLGYADKGNSLFFIPIGVNDNSKYFQFVIIPSK